MTESRAEWRTEWMKDRVDELNGWPVGRRRGSAKVQIGAELLCKSAKVNSGVGVGTGVGVGKPFGSRVSAVGSQVQVFRYGYRFRT
jgi:hypothetical protein